jgi:hypothetical protein
VADRTADPPVDRLRPPARASAADRRVRGGQPAAAWGPRLVAVAVLSGLVVVLAVLLGVV